MQPLYIVAAVSGLLTLLSVESKRTYDIYYQWKMVEFDFPSNINLNSSEFIQENNFISLLKIFENRMWITTPRYLRGVPVALSTVPYNHVRFWWQQFFSDYDESPKLKPFPTYEMNEVGNCNALQLVHAMEIDQFGRLWVVDIGRVNILEEVQQNLCPAKLVIFDVTDGRSDVISTYIFPNDVAPHTSNILKEIQVACETLDDCWVFIPDIAMSRLVVYDHRNKESWTAQHPSMAPDKNKINFSINGAPTMAPFGINGLVLAPRKYNFSVLYFSPLASTTLYTIKTDILKNSALKLNETLQQNDVAVFGEKPGQSDGLAMTSKGRLYYGNLIDSSVLLTETKPQLMHIKEQKIVAQSSTDLLWPDNFAFDGKGKLALTTTKFQLFLSGMLNTTEFNYRVIVLRHTGDIFANTFC